MTKHVKEMIDRYTQPITPESILKLKDIMTRPNFSGLDYTYRYYETKLEDHKKELWHTGEFIALNLVLPAVISPLLSFVDNYFFGGGHETTTQYVSKILSYSAFGLVLLGGAMGLQELKKYFSLSKEKQGAFSDLQDLETELSRLETMLAPVYNSDEWKGATIDYNNTTQDISGRLIELEKQRKAEKQKYDSMYEKVDKEISDQEKILESQEETATLKYNNTFEALIKKFHAEPPKTALIE